MKESSQPKPIGRFLQHLVLLPLAVSFAMAAAQSAPAPSSPEEALFRMTNSARTEQGVAPLQWDDSLARAAQSHAQLILQNSQLSHEYPGEANLALRAAQAGAHFQTVAENIGEGGSVESIQKGWMHSPAHRADILNPNLNAVGFAVLRHGEELYAVADFSHSVPSFSVEQVEAAIAKLLAARGVKADGPTLDARQSCEIEHGAAGGSKPRFIMRWQTSDLSQLPAPLEDRLRTDTYNSAAVGACSSANAESGFTTYRIAVLLY